MKLARFRFWKWISPACHIRTNVGEGILRVKSRSFLLSEDTNEVFALSLDSVLHAGLADSEASQGLMTEPA